MNEYTMSEEVFLQRAIEEDCCMIAGAGSDLLKALHGSETATSANILQHRPVQGDSLAPVRE